MSAGRRSLLALSAMVGGANKKVVPVVDSGFVAVGIVSGDSQSFYHPTANGPTFDYQHNVDVVVDWGDGTVQTIHYDGYSFYKQYNRDIDECRVTFFDGDYNHIRLVSNTGNTTRNKIREKIVECSYSDRIEIIGEYSTHNCTGLVKVNGMNNVTSIRSYAFQGCTSLEHAKFARPISYIGAQAFYKCGLMNFDGMVLADGVSIGNGAFNSCNGFSSAKLEGSVSSLGSSAFANTPVCDDFCNAVVRAFRISGATTIPSSLFLNCANITSLSIPEGYTVVSSSLFRGCTSLKKVSIPSSVIAFSVTAFGTTTAHMVANGLVVEMTGMTMSHVKEIKSTTSSSSKVGFPFGLDATQTKEQAVFHCSDGYMDCAGNPVEM